MDAAGFSGSNQDYSSDKKPLLTNSDVDNSNFSNDAIHSINSNNESLSTVGPVEINSSMWPPRKQKRETEIVEPGCLNLLSSRFESLDYEICENHFHLNEERTKGYKFIIKKNIARWCVFLVIGILTAVIGAVIDICIEELCSIKYKLLKKYVDSCLRNSCLFVPHLLWIATNVFPVLIGSLLVTYIEPVAAGSGIPQVKCYLNGVNIPRIVRIKTLFVKVVGVISSVVGGLAVGKEGPMIHSGAIVAAGVSQGKSTTFRKDFRILSYFREDHEKRDFVSGGAAAGVAAAFGAPVGGVLFSLEEGISFWNQSLTWKIFFCSLMSTFTLNVILSSYHGYPGQLNYSGLLNFGQFELDVLSYGLGELPIYFLMGALGGILGALFNQFNYKLTVFRIRYVNRKFLKLLEAVLVASVTATVGFVMMYTVKDCKPLGQDPTKFPIQMFCGDGEYNALAALWFQTPEASVRSLFHDPPGSHKPVSVFSFFLLYLILSCWTYGLSVSSGLFIPSLLTGAAWGRLVGMLAESLFPDSAWTDPGKFALIGAAAQLGGVVRMTISLTVILIEATGNITFGLPLMITLIMAKWTGDFFNEGIYDIHTRLQGVPLLAWSPPPQTSNIYATEIMSCPVVTLQSNSPVERIVQVLTDTKHNGFPVVDGHEEVAAADNLLRPGGRLRGIILRSQLIVLLKNRLFNESFDCLDVSALDLRMFRDEYPRYSTIDDIRLDDEHMGCSVDLRPFMNPSPYTVQHSASLPRVFRLFRALGLRHVVVVNDRHQVVGMITRKDLARYRVWRHGPSMGLEELKISQKMA